MFHEMSSPLSVLSTGVAMIHSEGLTDVGLEALEITKSNCSAIVTKLKEIQSLQVSSSDSISCMVNPLSCRLRRSSSVSLSISKILFVK